MRKKESGPRHGRPFPQGHPHILGRSRLSWPWSPQTVVASVTAWGHTVVLGFSIPVPFSKSAEQLGAAHKLPRAADVQLERGRFLLCQVQSPANSTGLVWPLPKLGMAVSSELLATLISMVRQSWSPHCVVTRFPAAFTEAQGIQRDLEAMARLLHPWRSMRPAVRIGARCPLGRRGKSFGNEGHGACWPLSTLPSSISSTSALPLPQCSSPRVSLATTPTSVLQGQTLKMF